MSQKTYTSPRLIVIVVLISSLVVDRANQQAAALSRGPQIIQIVIDKLEAFRSGLSDSSHLTVDELKEANEEFQSWPVESLQLALQKPQLRLLFDLVIQPVQSIEFQYEKEDYDLFIEQVERIYAEFMPVYVNSEKFVGVNSVRAAKTSELMKKILDADPKLSLVHFERARDEYESWNRKYEEMVFHEDVMGQLSVLRELFNFFNSKYNAVLKLNVYPLLSNGVRDPQQLRTAFLDSLKEQYNIVVKDGRFTEIRSANQLDLSQVDLPEELRQMLMGGQLSFTNSAQQNKAESIISAKPTTQVVASNETFSKRQVSIH